MPEEKKENKAVAKDSFTFSDKIKNSKPAASKSFANRISSKIGSDGKPKKTLFERTKRDAPFFIAAIVALLLLPFLYKYSGSVDEGPAMVTPGQEETLFDPNRSGFDNLTGDPDGQIAQLSGRDSMDLIVGFGNKKEEEPDESPFNPNLISGLDDDYSNSNNNSKEYNEKNIYKYKKQAAPATKAAFKKTNINPLRGAGLTSRGGGKLGVGMWGGGLKKAADKVKADAPKSSPKPVSLQPLQAAGKPSRSYFGQGAAAEARRSKDAMSKANAMQALMDAQMKPIEPGKIGGIGGGDFGGPGGGNGNLDRKFAFNGKEPWWWDMMKKRSQMEWEAKFNRKWDWIKFGDKLAQKLLDGLLSCVITGTDDWSMGKMFGAKEGAGKVTKCNKYTEDTWKTCSDCMAKGPFSKAACWNLFQYKGEEGQKDPWSEGNPSSSDLNFLQVRWDCLTNGAFDARKARKAAEGFAETNDCNTFYNDGRYYASVNGDYAIYHYVVGVRENDWQNYVKLNSDNERKELLSVGFIGKGPSFSVEPNTTTQFINNKKFVPLFIESVAVKSKKVKKKDVGTVADEKTDDAADLMAMLITKEECKKQSDGSLNCPKKASNLKYVDFLAKLRKGGLMAGDQADGKNSSVSVLMSVKGGKEGKDWRTGARCAYPLAFVSCHHDAKPTADMGETNAAGAPVAFLTFPNVGHNKQNGENTSFYGDIIKRFTVTYKVGDRFAPQGKEGYSSKGYFAQQVKTLEGYAESKQEGAQKTPNNDRKYNVVAAGKGLAAIEAVAQTNGKADANKSAAVTWEVRQCWDPVTPWNYARAIEDGACGRPGVPTGDGVDASKLPGQIVSTATCVYGDEGAVSSGVQENKCPKGKDTNEECCKELGGPNYEYVNGVCKAPVQEDQNPNPNPNPGPGPDPVVGTVRLAPVIEWVPSDITARKPLAAGVVPTASDFTGSKAIATGKDDQHCGDGMSNIAIESADAKTFVNSVVAAYNKSAKVPMTELSSTYPTMGEFVDALYMANQLGIASVSKDAVCHLGQAMAQVSRDKHAGSLTWGENKPFYNELGSYLAYVHPEAAYYPSKYYEEATNCDKRFLAVAEAGCPESILVSGVKGHREFHHGNYAWNGNSSRYLQSLSPAMKQYPLRALAEGVTFNASGCTKGCGPKRKEYNQKFRFLLRGQCPKGNMQVADALKYVTGVCSTGLDYKPQGTPGSASGPSSDTSGSSGNNNSVRGR